MRKYPINFVAVVYSRNGDELVRSQKKKKIFDPVKLLLCNKYVKIKGNVSAGDTYPILILRREKKSCTSADVISNV